MKKKRIILFFLIAFILFFFYFAVIGRNPGRIAPRYILDLFWIYRHPGSHSFKGICLNILCFIPIGIMVGLISDKYRILKVLIVGLFVSLVVEFSQLIWAKGVFDVDDLFNNSLGAAVGGLAVVLALKLWNKQ